MASFQGPLLYEGKAKKVFGTDHPEECLVLFKNDITAFNSKKHAHLESKGSLNCQISALVFKLLERNGIPTHFLAVREDSLMLVQKVEIIPLEIVVRNVASGSLCKETPIKAGSKLAHPLVDFYYKDDDLADPLLTDARLDLLDLVTLSQRMEIKNLALRVNNCLKDFFQEIDLLLVDFKIEVGFNKNGELLVSDEISPDSCRIWDLNIENQEDRILDKDRFRKDLGGLTDSYLEVLRRIQSSNQFSLKDSLN